MTSMRDDARRVLEARRVRASSTPAPFAAPVAATLALIAVGAVVLTVLGFSVAATAGILFATALAGAVAAHRTTTSVLAGITLWLVQPFQPGERVRIFAPERHAVVEAELVRIGLVNTTLATEAELLVVANARLLRPAPRPRG